MAMAFSPDSNRLALTCYGNAVWLWDLTTGDLHCIVETDFTLETFKAVAFSPDGKLIAMAPDDITVLLWDLTTSALHFTMSLVDNSVRVMAVALSPGGKLLATALHDRTVRLWDIEAEKEIQILNTGERIFQLSFSSCGSYLETSEGTLEINPTRNESQSFPNPPYRLCVRKHWICWGTQKLLCLPFDYRPNCWSALNNIIALGYNSGQVTFIEFNLDSIPFGELF
jgi:WD40 repeat protein